ncbi:MAG: RNA polymerase sigma-70 factor, ECF subfamily [Parcubacteria bacterium C7867-006]|nr:MAG: RNA polymerase sigma-70 factor, ECF subfamily [Parcubacteria bacterium C7867-006]
MNSNTESLSDEELAGLVQKGDTDKFGVLMERYQAKLFRYGKKFLYDSDNIEDVVQDVFIKTYQNINSFDVNQRFSPWIYRIAHNTYVNAIKKSSVGPMYLFDFDALVSHTVVDDPIVREKEQREMKDVVDKGLSLIEPKYREILVLYFIEELSYKEISDILHIPIGTVGVRIMRAKEILRDAMEKTNIEIPKI